MNSVIGTIFVSYAVIGGADAPTAIVLSNKNTDIAAICVLGIVFIGLIVLYIIKKKNKK